MGGYAYANSGSSKFREISPDEAAKRDAVRKPANAWSKAIANKGKAGLRAGASQPEVVDLNLGQSNVPALPNSNTSLRGGVTMLSREEEQTPFAGIPQSAQDSMTRTNRENLAGPGQTSQAINPSGGGQAQIFANGSKFSGAEQGGTSVYSPTKQSGFAPAANMQDRVASYGRATDTYKQMGNIRKGLSAGGGNSDGRAKQPRAQKPHIGWGERKRMQNIMTELQSLNGHSHGKYAAPALLAEYKNILGQGQATNQLQNNLDMQGMRNTGGAEVAGIGANAQTGVAGLRAGAGLQQAQINNQGQNFRNQASNQMQMDRQGMIGEQASGLAAMNNKSAENRARIAGQYSLAGAGLKAGGKSGGGLANTDKLISRYKKTGRDLPQGAAQGIYASSSARHLNNPAQVDSLLAATYSKYPELKDLLDLSDGKTWDAMIQAQKTGNWEAVRPKN